MLVIDGVEDGLTEGVGVGVSDPDEVEVDVADKVEEVDRVMLGEALGEDEKVEVAEGVAVQVMFRHRSHEYLLGTMIYLIFYQFSFFLIFFKES